MGLYEKMQTSPRLESEGIWLQIDDNRIRLARAGGKNTKFITAAEKIAREHKRALELMGEEQGRKLFSELFAKIIVLDWLIRSDDGVLDEEGVPFNGEVPEGASRWQRGTPSETGEIMPFDVVNVLRVFSDIPDLLRMVKETSEDAALFRQELLKDVEGNS